MGETKPLFRNLTAEDPEPETTEIESMCMNCQANGTTRLLLTKIPFYKEVVLMSFTCDHCGYHNNEIQSGSIIPEKGIRITLKVNSVQDLNRQVVKSDFTSLKIPELDFEIPAQSQKGEVTTVEGVINRVISGLQQDQPVRREQQPEAANQIEQFIQKLTKLKDVKEPFTFEKSIPAFEKISMINKNSKHNETTTSRTNTPPDIELHIMFRSSCRPLRISVLEDISGNCFIENPNAPKVDPQSFTQHFNRTKEQNHLLGIFTQEEVSGEPEKTETGILHSVLPENFTLEDLQGEVLQFRTNCTACGSPCETNMKMTNIPHFKEVVIMATVCDVCGYKTNEVKSGSGVEPKGVQFEVKVRSEDDFSRDVLKSDTCSLKIPELEIEVGPHALGGRFTTIEGLIVAIKDQLNNPQHSHMFGDSMLSKAKEEFQEFIKKFDAILEGKTSVTVILDDPAGNSYVQSMRDDDQPDEGLKVTHYERTYEQNEELGLNDMKTENY